ncbi:MAG: hypothetical protein H7246_02555 [Phycisphaerae bacterium]|nr:hypothetical protein [Saprospiraceae bacterium]
MFHCNVLHHCLCLSILTLLMACHMPVRVQSPEILAYFPSLPLRDTLHIEIADENTQAGDTIPNRLFFTSIPSALLQQIDYLADSSQAIVLGRQQFPLGNNISAYWVEVRQFWFQHHSLFLYNKSKRQFTDRITVAEWYGGDGGQVLIGSWMFDYDGDGKKDIVRREIQHSMIPKDDEPLEQLSESASILMWKNGRFVDTPFQDTAAVMRRFPIRSFW